MALFANGESSASSSRVGLPLESMSILSSTRSDPSENASDPFLASSTRDPAPTEVQSWGSSFFFANRLHCAARAGPARLALDNELVDLTAEVPPFCRPSDMHEDLVPRLCVCDRQRCPVGAHEAYSLRVLEHGRPFLAIGFRLYH